MKMVENNVFFTVTTMTIQILKNNEYEIYYY